MPTVRRTTIRRKIPTLKRARPTTYQGTTNRRQPGGLTRRVRPTIKRKRPTTYQGAQNKKATGWTGKKRTTAGMTKVKRPTRKRTLPKTYQGTTNRKRASWTGSKKRPSAGVSTSLNRNVLRRSLAAARARKRRGVPMKGAIRRTATTRRR